MAWSQALKPAKPRMVPPPEAASALPGAVAHGGATTVTGALKLSTAYAGDGTASTARPAVAAVAAVARRRNMAAPRDGCLAPGPTRAGAGWLTGGGPAFRPGESPRQGRRSRRSGSRAVRRGSSVTASRGGPVRRSVRLSVAAVVAVAVAAGAVGTVDVLRARDAGAAESETYPLPPGGGWTVVGKGWGHGRGMSQWGSQGAARLGRTGSAILDFYYPSTLTTTIPAAPIRVRLSDDAAGTHLEHGDGTSWTRWTAPDGRSAWAGALRFGAGSAGVLTLYIGQAPAAYRGTLTAVPTGTTTVATVNTVDLDLYLRSVVPAESPASWLAAALRAQAVAARAYAAYGPAPGAGKEWDTCDTTACQVYKGTVSEATTTTKAVQDTANQVRTLSGQPILAEFSASNGGWTMAGVAPYQVAKADPYDEAGGTNPVANWTTTLTAESVRTRYPEAGTPTALRVVTRTGNGTWGGRITDLW